MKFIIILSLVFMWLPSCQIQKREEQLKQKESELRLWEQKLLLKEDSLRIKAAELAKNENLLDTTKINTIDSLSALHSNVAGMWNVSMKCIEATCSGSAVGDTKKEQWQITIENNTIIAKAMSDNKLLRIYSGSFVGNAFELSAQQENVPAQLGAKMFVRLQQNAENEMSGQREISRPEDCRIVYALELNRQ